MYYFNRHSVVSFVTPANEPPMGYVRALHAVPDAPQVDIYINGKTIARNLAFEQNTAYAAIPEGNYEISLYPVGTTFEPALINSLDIQDHSATTVAVVGTPDDISFLAIPDSAVSAQTGNAMVRFGHLSPFVPAVDINLPDGTTLFEGVSFKELTSYAEVPPGIYTLQAGLTGSPDIVLTTLNARLEPNEAYTVYAISITGREGAAEAILLSDWIL